MSLSGNVTLKAMWNKIKKDYIHNLDMVRDAFFGGRMEAFKMYEEASQTQKIKYYDVTSLYLFVNKTGKIPIGHHHIITENFNNIDQYEEMIKCKLLPPRKLHVDILLVNCIGKLMLSFVT